jgi:hypothetical protein
VTAQLECLLDDVVVGKQEMVSAIDAVGDHPAARRVVSRWRGGEDPPKLLDDGHIDTVIGLPANLFYSTGIQVCILILKKNDGDPQQRGIRHGCLEKIPVRHDAPQRQSPGRVFRGSAARS